MRYEFHTLSEFEFEVDPSKLPKPTPLQVIPLKEGAKEIPAHTVLQVATQNNMACLKTAADYEYLMAEYIVLQKAMKDYIQRYNDAADKHAKQTETQK